MATVQQLIDRIEYLVDDDITLEKCIMLINMALDDLSEVAGFLKIAETGFLKGQRNVVTPNDLIDVESVFIRKKGETKYRRSIDAFVHKYEREVQEELAFSDFPLRDEVQRYRLIDDMLIFLPEAPYDGDIEIKYYAMLPSISEADLNEIPKLRLQHHKAIPLYAAAKYHQNWKDSLNEKNDFWNEYMTAKAALAQDTADRKQRSKSQYIVKTRGWF